MEIVFENCAPFTDWISEMNNTKTDNAKYIDVAMLIYNLIEYSNNYWKIWGSLWQYFRDELALSDTSAIFNFHVANKSSLSKFKQKQQQKNK